MTGADPETFCINIKIKQILFLSFFFSSDLGLLHNSYIFYFLKPRGSAAIPTHLLTPPMQEDYNVHVLWNK